MGGHSQFCPHNFVQLPVSQGTENVKKSQGDKEDCPISSAFSCSDWKMTEHCWKTLIFLLFHPLGKAKNSIFHYKTWIVPVPTKTKFTPGPRESAQLQALPGPSRGAAQWMAVLFWHSSSYKTNYQQAFNHPGDCCLHRNSWIPVFYLTSHSPWTT